LFEKSAKEASFLGTIVTGSGYWVLTYKSESKQVIRMAHHIIPIAKPVSDCVVELEIHMDHIFQKQRHHPSCIWAWWDNCLLLTMLRCCHVYGTAREEKTKLV
jgi:hypothetical protein